MRSTPIDVVAQLRCEQVGLYSLDAATLSRQRGSFSAHITETSSEGMDTEDISSVHINEFDS